MNTTNFREVELLEIYRKLPHKEKILVNMAAKLYLAPNEKPYKQGNIINMAEWLIYSGRKSQIRKGV